jgi:hypothetical protein
MFACIGLPTVTFAWFLISNLPGWGVVLPAAVRAYQPINRNTRDLIGAVPSQSALASPWPVTKAKYEVVQEGMTYDQVRTVIGAAGDEVSRSYIAGLTTVMYLWKNSNGSNMNAMFQNERLITKAQWGLE